MLLVEPRLKRFGASLTRLSPWALCQSFKQALLLVARGLRSQYPSIRRPSSEKLPDLLILEAGSTFIAPHVGALRGEFGLTRHVSDWFQG